MASAKKLVDRRARIESWYVEESPLYFFNKERSFDPKLGLTHHGPVDAPSAERKPQETIRIGIIATGAGRQEVLKLLKLLSNGVDSNNKNPLKSPPFGGMNTILRCNVLTDERFNEDILGAEIQTITDILNYDRRVKYASELYSRKLGIISGRVSKPDVVICYQTTELESSIGSKASGRIRNEHRVPEAERRRLDQIRKNAQEYQLFAPLDEETLNMLDMLVNQDFELALKAECMKFEIPTQIIAQSTIDEVCRPLKDEGEEKKERGQDPAGIAWNLAVGLYYKSGRIPWRVADLKDGTCYVGISFYVDQTSPGRETKTSLAQIFTDTGEGLVISGSALKEPETKKKSPHLDKDGARKLIADAIVKYQEHRQGQLPTRLVIHKSSEFYEDELAGFNEARGNIKLYDYVSMRDTRDIYFLRDGTESVIRGSVFSINNAKQFVYTSGHIPHLGAYPGPRIPIPLEISQHIGESSAEDIVREILALTRLNWNSANFSSFLPMTLHFAKRVRGILARIPNKTAIKNEYRYYM